MTVSDVALAAVTVAAAVPIVTVLVAVVVPNPLPLIVTGVPPAVGPELGLTLVIAGGAM